SARARRTASWSNGSKAAFSRPQIAPALAVESCWPQTIWASPTKPGSRRRRLGMPAISSTGLSRVSRLTSAWTASSRSDWVSRWMVMATSARDDADFASCGRFGTIRLEPYHLISEALDEFEKYPSRDGGREGHPDRRHARSHRRRTSRFLALRYR